MKKLCSAWSDYSVATKLYIVVGVMVALILVELLTLRFAMNQLSALRAFAASEGMWSKAQKTSLISLMKYVQTRDEQFYSQFISDLEVPVGDNQGRVELLKDRPDYKIVRDGFERGKNHPEDIDGIVFIMRNFYWVPHVKTALATWEEGDRLLVLYMNEAKELHDLIKAKSSETAIKQQLIEVEKINGDLSVLQDKFTNVIGEGSRWMKNVLIVSVLILVITIEGSGLFLTVTFARSLRRKLLELIEAAQKIGRGKFDLRVPVTSRDELGQLSGAINSMALELEETIGTKEQAERANRTKTMFLANMSHEIRTPLTAILGFTDALKDTQLSGPERLEYLEIINRNGLSLSRLIDDILDLSKVEAGDLAIEAIEFSLPTLLQEIVDLFKARATEKGLVLSLDIEASARKAVRTDPTRLRQIVTNLIGNAIKFTKDGSISISAATVKKSGAEHIIINVTDSGIGLEPEQTERLFKVFSQADESTSRKFGGTGLGLVLSRRLAECLGGTVELRSSVFGKGSCFEVRVLNRPQGLALPREKVSDISSEKINLKKVLIAEDTADTRILLQRFFKKYKIEADIVANGLEAVSSAKKNKYDLIILDIQMPEMDGFEAFKEIKKLGIETPIVALTAHALTDERNKILKFGFHSHLAKPFNEESLVALLASHG